MNNDMKKLTRSLSNRMVAGVCAGLGKYLSIDPTVVRLIFLLAFFVTFSTAGLVYLAMWLVIPEETEIIHKDEGDASQE